MEKDSDQEDTILSSENNGHRRFKFYLDPGVFLLFFGWNLSGTVIVNEIQVQTCHVTYNFSKHDCHLLRIRDNDPVVEEIKNTIQPYVAQILMVRMMVESIIPAILNLVLGPFSNRFGRKLILNSTSIGLTLYFAAVCLWRILSNHYPISPWFYGLSILFYAFSGGFYPMLAAMLSYTTDCSTEENRSSRITIVELMITLGVLLGTFISSYLVKIMTPLEIFLVSLSCIGVSAIYIIFFIKETIIMTEENRKLRGCDKVKTVVSIENFVDLVKTCLRHRENRKRFILLMMMFILLNSVFVQHGTLNLFFLFEQKKFNWSVSEANLYDSATMVLSVFGTLSGLFILKRLLNLTDILIIMISFFSKICSTFIITFATVGWHLYVASGVGFIGNLYGSFCRGMISKTVDKDEVGKIFAVSTTLEAFWTLAAAPIYTQIYTSTYLTFTSAFNLVTVNVLILNVILSFYVAFVEKKSRNSNYNSRYED